MIRFREEHASLLLRLLAMRRCGTLKHAILAESHYGVTLAGVGVVTWSQARRIAEGDPVEMVVRGRATRGIKREMQSWHERWQECEARRRA